MLQYLKKQVYQTLLKVRETEFWQRWLEKMFTEKAPLTKKNDMTRDMKCVLSTDELRATLDGPDG